MPARVGERMWTTDSPAERDALGEADGLRVGDVCNVIGTGLFVAATVGGSSTWDAVGGGGSSGWITDYEVDFSTLPNANLKTGGDAPKVIDGQTWNGQNMASATSFDVVSGTGIVIVSGPAGNNMDGNTETIPEITLPLLPIVAPGFKFGDKLRVWSSFEVANMNTGNDTRIQLGYRYGASASQTVNGKNWSLQGPGSSGGSDAVNFKTTSNNISTSRPFNFAPYNDPTSQVCMMELSGDLTSAFAFMGLGYGATPPVAWPDENNPAEMFPMFSQSTLDPREFQGGTIEYLFGLLDLTNQITPTVTLKRLRVQRLPGS